VQERGRGIVREVRSLSSLELCGIKQLHKSDIKSLSVKKRD
jgi:hypothetical protein